MLSGSSRDGIAHPLPLQLVTLHSRRDVATCTVLQTLREVVGGCPSASTAFDDSVENLLEDLECRVAWPGSTAALYRVQKSTFRSLLLYYCLVDSPSLNEGAVAIV